MPAFEPKELIKAWNTHEPDRVAEHYAEDAELQTPEKSGTLRGRRDIRENVHGWMRAFPDVTGDIEMTCRSDREVALLVHFSGTHTGPLSMGDGQTLEPTDREVRMPVAMFLTLDGSGRIARERDVFNMGDLIEQLSIPAEAVRRMYARSR